MTDQSEDPTGGSRNGSARGPLAFDLAGLHARLAALAVPARAVFCLLVTERQLPALTYASVTAGRGDPERALQVLERSWRTALAADAVTDPEPLLATVAAAVPGHPDEGTTEDVAEWLEYAADAAWSLETTVLVLAAADEKLAVEPARAGYRIADAYALRRLTGPGTGPAVITPAVERQVLADDMVQTELHRQASDLRAAKAWRGTPDDPGLRAYREARRGTSVVPVPPSAEAG